MKLTRVGASLAMTAVAALALSACAGNETKPQTTGGAAETGAATQQAEQLSGSLTGSGATSQGTAQSAWIAGYNAVQPGVTINYGGGGSGQGRTDFTAGTSQFAGSDRAFKTDEISAGGFAQCAEGSGLVEIPAYISPIAVAFKLDGVKELKLDADTLAGIFAGQITNWNDPKIAATNAGVTLPDLPITAVHRSDKSGTTQNFTDYLAQAAPSVWTEKAAEEWPAAFGGEGANQTDGVQQALASNGTIGYLDASAATNMTTVSVKVGNDFVKLTPEAAAAVIDASKVEDGRAETDLAFKIERNTTASGAYPIVLVSYLVGCAEYKDAEIGKLVKSYFQYVVSEEGQQAAATAAHSAPISDELRTKIETALEQMK
ncbi:Phosphate-binding protein PstS3 [Pseudoclavibacter triregionum]|nr:Phosphate-binding protein PstS3 [Pseudoclavibacter triregionum]